MIPKMSVYSVIEVNKPQFVKRRARFAPQLLADGLTSGIVSDQGNLVHGAFDDGPDVDVFANIHSDKFDILNQSIQPVTVDPGSTQPTSSVAE